MDEIIEKSRKVFCKVLNFEDIVFETLEAGDLGGLCGVSQSSLYYVAMKYMVDVRPIQLSPYFSRWSHACVIINHGGKEYMADLTISQFIYEFDEIGLSFVKRGYMELTDVNIEWLYKLLEKGDNMVDKRNILNRIEKMELDHDEEEIIF